MSWLGVILLAIIEGLTEFLPISSTGHMILASHILRLETSDFLKSFEIIVQLGAIIAVLVVYWSTLWQRKDYWIKIFAALVPTLFIGYFLYPLVKQFLLSNVLFTLCGLIVGAVLIFIIEAKFKNKPKSEATETLTNKQAFIIGVVQVLAIFPGISRSAATILAGMVLGQSRENALQFSFLLAVPVMLAATGLEIMKNGFSFNQTEWMQLAVGLVISFLVALFSIKWLIRFVHKQTLVPFAWYRIAAVVIFTSLLVLDR